MDEKTLLGPDSIRREALAEFAALTRHKPQALDRKFECDFRVSQELATGFIVLRFGKRKASGAFPADKLALSVADFGAEVLKPLAKALLVSVD